MVSTEARAAHLKPGPWLEERRERLHHHARLDAVSATVDAGSPKARTHVRSNLKRKKLEQDRAETVARANAAGRAKMPSRYPASAAPFKRTAPVIQR